MQGKQPSESLPPLRKLLEPVKDRACLVADMMVITDDADVNRLEELTVRVKHAASWQELLGLARPRRRSPQRKPSS